MADIDRHSATWRALEQHLRQRRQSTVEALISGSPHDERRRGEIRMIDELLALAAPAEQDAPPPVTYD